jgi:beta-glucanase (GH16 family)
MNRIALLLNSTRKRMTYFTNYPVLLLILLIAALCGCNNKPYVLEDDYIYVQKKGRDTMKDSWELVWQDEFNTVELDTTVWTRIDRWTDADFQMSKEEWLGNPEKWKDVKNLGCFSYTSADPDLYDCKDGMLILDGIVNKDTLFDPRPYLQGAVKSKRKFAFQYGKLEIRAKLEAAKGAWPAFWMLSEKEIYGDLPNRNGEIDIMERLNYDEIVYQTTHSYWTIKMKQKQNPPYYSTAKFNPDVYNVFGIEWYPNKLVYTVNGKTTYEYPKLEGVDAAQWPFDQPFYVMLDQQLGGGWVGEIDPKDLPVKVFVDWIRLYQ